MTESVGEEKLIVVLGPTATGKTRLAVELAKTLETDIVSGDSMLVYRGFDIGSAKPDVEERGGVRHALVDILAPTENFNVTDFQRLAAAEIRAANDAGKIPILAGGTGLYLKALLEGYRFNREPEDGAYRASLEALAKERGKAHVHALLEAIDPEAAARLHVNDFRRVVRALEVAREGRSRISQEKQAHGLAYDACVLGLRCERRELYRRIEARVDAMMAAGLEAEVRRLLASGIPRDAQAMQGIGYKEMAAYIGGELTMEAAVAEIKKATRRFAKRQITWYKKMPYIHWLDVDKLSREELVERSLAEVSRTITHETRGDCNGDKAN